MALLSYVTLGVASLGVATAFYERILDKQARRSTTGSFLDLGSARLALLPAKTLAEETGMPPERCAGTGVLLSLNVRSREEVDALLRRAPGAGGRVIRPAAEVEGRGYFGCFADPDGHPWEVAFNPRFKFA